MSECDNCKNKKNFPCPNSCGYMGFCDGYEPKPKTNGDRIRSMSDEDLALERTAKGDCPHICEEPDGIYTDCVKCWLDWLKQEAK